MDDIVSYLRKYFAIKRDLAITVEYKKKAHRQFNVFNPTNGGLAHVTLHEFYSTGDYFFAGYCVENQRLYIIENID